MAMMINDSCIRCGICVPECPNGAIREGEENFYIRAGLCTECTGKYDQPQCQALCPVYDCVLPRPDRRESREALQAKQEKIDLRNRIEAAMKAAGL